MGPFQYGYVVQKIYVVLFNKTMDTKMSDEVKRRARSSDEGKEEAKKEWDKLSEFQRQFRATHKITGQGLIAALQLPSSCLQLLYTRKANPSIKEGTIGAQLRAKLRELMEHPEKFQAINESWASRLRDFFDEHCLDLEKKLGITSLYSTDCEEEIRVHTTRADISADVLLENLKLMDPDLFGKVTKVIRRVFMNAQLCEMPTPIKPAASNGFGTASFILTEFGLYGITAKHVLKCDDHMVVHGFSPQHNEELSERVPKSKNPNCRIDVGWVKPTLTHEHLDIALFELNEAHSFLVNAFMVGKQKLSFQLHVNVSAEYLLNKQVTKYGISTRFTRGKVVHADDYLIEIESTEYGAFCAPGDSGALILIDEPDNRVAIAC